MNKVVKPFVKWVGGKTQLLKEIENLIPNDITNSKFTYVEPFVGGGAVLFWVLQKYKNIDKVVINDINLDLINSYLTVKNNVNELILILKEWEYEYNMLNNRIDYYYDKRKLFNSRTLNSLYQSALFIFLNKTCFNGLYRVNKKNEFNVPMGSYKNPTICDVKNLRAVSDILKDVIILNGDFEDTLKYAYNNTIFYLDPPYKPLTKTSSFTSYSKLNFNDDEQVRLSKFCKNINNQNSKFILSNSDVKSIDNNDFFDKLYSGFKFKKVLAKRSINSNPNKRGELTELLITN